MRVSKPEPERFLEKFEIGHTDSCWKWCGSTTRGGYGHFRRKINGKWTMGRAHRYSYEYHNKLSIDDVQGLAVCHHCDNPICVNPYHLFLGSIQENTDDKVIKGRHKWGSKEGHNTLSPTTVQAIRDYKENNPNISYIDLGTMFGTSGPQAFRVVKQHTHKGE